MDPYRGELVRVEPRALVAEPERPPRGIRVRAWSDGTTQISLRKPTHLSVQLFLSAVTLCLLASAGDPLLPNDRAMCLISAALPAFFLLRSFAGETISVSPAALSRRRRLGRAEVRTLADVSTVVVSGSKEEPRLELQVGRERVALADGLGYDEPTLRWIAQRLRRAIEAAR